MIEYKMTLTDEEKEILEGKQGETKQKMMETLALTGFMKGRIEELLKAKG